MKINKRVYYGPNSFTPLGVKIKIKIKAKKSKVPIVNLKEKQKQKGTVQRYCISPPLEFIPQPQSLELHVRNLSSEMISSGQERPLSQQ